MIKDTEFRRRKRERDGGQKDDSEIDDRGLVRYRDDRLIVW